MLATAGADGLTRKGIWDALPAEYRRNEPAVRLALADGAGEGWEKEDRPARAGGAVYRLGE